MAELLLADHQSLKDKHGSEGSWRQSGEDELKLLQTRFNLPGSRFATDGIDRGQDDSSPVISVDHDACILCDRCVRACNEVRENGVHRPHGQGLRPSDRVRSERSDGRIVVRGLRRVHDLLPDRRRCRTGWCQRRWTTNRPASSADHQARSSSRSICSQHPLFKDISLPFLIWNRERDFAADI